MKKVYIATTVAVLSVVIAYGCGSSSAPASTDAGVTLDARGPENTGQSYNAPTDCFADIDAASLIGEVKCLDRVTGGYCTHLCQADTECCAVPGECRTGFKQVCSPFESTAQMTCFLSCETADLRPASDGGVLDENAYCETYAGIDFKCRSSGGGNKNRKVCLPGGASPDAGSD